jgi:hypothetical protein
MVGLHFAFPFQMVHICCIVSDKNFKRVRYSGERCAELVSVSTVISLMDRVIDLR